MVVDGASVPPYGALSLCGMMQERPPLVFGDGSVMFQGALSGGCASPPCRAVMLDLSSGPAPPPIVVVKEGDAVPGGGTFEAPLLLDANTDCENDTDDDPADDGLMPTVNDGCPTVGTAEAAGAPCANSLDDDADGMVNDGCAVVGTTGESGTRILFRDTVAGGAEGLFLATAPGSFASLVRVGDSIPAAQGGGTVATLGAADMSGSGALVWHASLTGGRADAAIYRGASPAPVELVSSNSPESSGTCSDSVDGDGDGHINEGCPVVVFAAENCTNALDDDADGLVNDGCPTQGARAEKEEQCANTANDDPVDDGGTPRVNDGCPSSDAESDQCADGINADEADDGGTPKVNDGCVTAGGGAESGSQCDNSVNDDPTDDATINDGCPTVGAAAEADQCDNGADEDGDGATNDGCPTGGDYWTDGATYRDPIVSLSGTTSDFVGTTDHNDFYNQGPGDPNDPDDRPPTATFGATTQTAGKVVLTVSASVDAPLGNPDADPMKLAAQSDPWYGGESYQALNTAGPCTNATDDDAFDDGGSPTVNDGCAAEGTAESGAQCTNAADDDGDGYVNDGCPIVGKYAEGGLGSIGVSDSTGNGVLVGGSAGGTDIESSSSRAARRWSRRARWRRWGVV